MIVRIWMHTHIINYMQACMCVVTLNMHTCTHACSALTYAYILAQTQHANVYMQETNRNLMLLYMVPTINYSIRTNTYFQLYRALTIMYVIISITS